MTHGQPRCRHGVWGIAAQERHEATTFDANRADPHECAAFAKALVETCRAVEPKLDPLGSLPRVRVPTQVIHGRGDRLVPFTEGIRLMERLPTSFQRGVTVTGMSNHSKDHVPSKPIEHAREAALLFRALHQLVNTI